MEILAPGWKKHNGRLPRGPGLLRVRPGRGILWGIMHQTNHSQWRHAHRFGADCSAAERSTRVAMGITAVMMVTEIVAGSLSHSMALLADGWHMSTHVAAFLIAALAYYFSRRHGADPRYSFGTGKMGVLGGFTSAVVLAGVALLMAAESVHRFFVPLPIHFNEAIGIACLGLVVNLTCAQVLGGAGGHHSEPGAGQHGHTHDLNLRSAYLHVLADAFTTLLAIVGLLAGKFLGWGWFDPLVGLAGSGVVFSWAVSLVRATSGILLDRMPETSDLPEVIRGAIEGDGDSVITDLHIWQVAAGRFAAVISVVAHTPQPSDAYRQRLEEHEELVHVTVETRMCPGPDAAAIAAA